jgi:hypothetical protein
MAIDCENESDGKCIASEFCIIDGSGILNEVKMKNRNGSSEYFIGESENSNIKKGEVKMSEDKIVKCGEVNKGAFEIATKLINMRQLDGNRMGLEDSNTNTNLISKHYSPLIVRKYNIVNGWPCWVGMICDEDLSDLDQIVNGVFDACTAEGMITNNLQQLRNVTGILSETIQVYYNGKKKNCVEGVIISLYCDKVFVQNAMGDFMNHTSCRIEYAGIMAMVPHI